MLDYSIMRPEGILVLRPHAPLSKSDFTGLSTLVDTYLADHSKLHGVLICSKSFPGWADFAGFAAHMRFASEHHQQVERVAIVTDSPLAGLAESLAKHFTSAEVRHFRYTGESVAMDWLEAAAHANLP